MSLHRSTLFAFKPERLKIENESIEMDEFTQPSDSDEELDDDTYEVISLHAIELARIPLDAAIKAIRESLDETRAYTINSTLVDKFEVFSDKTNIVLAAPLALGSALIIAILAFISGAALDCYEALNRKKKRAAITANFASRSH